MRKQWLVVAVILIASGELIDGRISENHLVGGFLVIGPKVVLLPFDLRDTELFNDFLDAVLKEAFEGEYLLGDKTVLLEVAVDYLPGVFLVDGVHWADFFEIAHYKLLGHIN